MQAFTGCPLIKRDLYYRPQFNLDEIEENLLQVRDDNDHFEDIVTGMQKKGTGPGLMYWHVAPTEIVIDD